MSADAWILLARQAATTRAKRRDLTLGAGGRRHIHHLPVQRLGTEVGEPPALLAQREAEGQQPQLVQLPGRAGQDRVRPDALAPAASQFAQPPAQASPAHGVAPRHAGPPGSRRCGARHDNNVEIDDELIERLQATECTEAEVVAREESGAARRLLATPPSEQRQVIVLSFFKELSHTEIAARVGIPLGTVKGRQRLTLDRMRRAVARAPSLAMVAG